MAEIAVAVIGGFSCLRDTIKICYDFARIYRRKSHGLAAKAETLRSLIDDVERRKLEAVARDEIIHSEVDDWLTRSKSLVEEEHSRPKNPSPTGCGLLSNCCWRCDAVEQVENLDSRLDAAAAKSFERVADPRPPPPVAARRIATTVKNFEMSLSVETALDKVMEALKEESGVRVVGVHGIPGVGKTTMVKRAAEKALEEKLFERVVFSTISGSPDLGKIQKEVAECLGITLGDDPASTIEDKIKREKKVLIVLDDIWKELVLTEVGIPIGSDLEQCGSKIVFTTGYQRLFTS